MEEATMLCVFVSAAAHDMAALLSLLLSLLRFLDAAVNLQDIIGCIPGTSAPRGALSVSHTHLTPPTNRAVDV